MDPYNPYAAPLHAPDPDALREGFVPLGPRTSAASVAIAAQAVFGFTTSAAAVVFGERLTGEQPDLGAAMLFAVSALGFLLAFLAAVILYCVWIHRAAKNLPALGRSDLTFTPGWCVGWFFVPFANLWKPRQAVTEIWLASVPDEEEIGWRAGIKPEIIGIWWATWVVGNIITNTSPRLPGGSAASMIGLVASVFTAVAAVYCIRVMRGIAGRQGAAAARLAERGD